mgnify:FL=1
MQEVDDRNHTKLYEDVVNEIAELHTGYEIDEDGYAELPGPLSDFISDSREKELKQELIRKLDIQKKDSAQLEKQHEQ